MCCPRVRLLISPRSSLSSFNVGNPNAALVHVDVILNPLTETAQKWSTLLRVRRRARLCAQASTEY